MRGEAAMGRTIPSWHIIVEQEITRLSRFKQFLGPEDRLVFDDLLSQCKLYAAEAGVLASPVKEVPLLLSMIFAQHKKLIELEKRINHPSSDVRGRLAVSSGSPCIFAMGS
jgi:hypothetical protein